MPATPAPATLFDSQTYTIRRQVFTLLGAKFDIFDAQGALLFHTKQKAFKLREDIRLFTGQDLSTEVLTIHARQIIDFSAAYDVLDPTTGEKVGALRRKGFKSMIRDEWEILDERDQPLGVVREDSTALAVIRRLIDFASLVLPQKYHVEIAGQPVAHFKQHFNPFVFRVTADFSPDTQGRLDRRLGIAAAILLSAIEGRQS